MVSFLERKRLAMDRKEFLRIASLVDSDRPLFMSLQASSESRVPKANNSTVS